MDRLPSATKMTRPWGSRAAAADANARRSGADGARSIRHRRARPCRRPSKRSVSHSTTARYRGFPLSHSWSRPTASRYGGRGGGSRIGGTTSQPAAPSTWGEVPHVARGVRSRMQAKEDAPRPRRVGELKEERKGRRLDGGLPQRDQSVQRPKRQVARGLHVESAIGPVEEKGAAHGRLVQPLRRSVVDDLVRRSRHNRLKLPRRAAPATTIGSAPPSGCCEAAVAGETRGGSGWCCFGSHRAYRSRER